MIFLVYVDGTLFNSPNETDIDIVLEKPRQLKMESKVEDNVSGFLGVLIKKLDGNTLLDYGVQRTTMTKIAFNKDLMHHQLSCSMDYSPSRWSSTQYNGVRIFSIVWQ